MTLFARIDVGGTEFDDSLDIEVVNATGDNNSSSTFNATFDNYNGNNINNFNVGDEVTIWADESNPPTTKIFSGTIEDRGTGGSENRETLNIFGRDFTQRLMDTVVEPQVFTDTEISVIITNIMADVPDITLNNVQVTSVTPGKQRFNNISTFDALKQLAALAGYVFYVDVDKDLHFEPKNSVSSGVTLDSTNLLSLNITETDDGLFNEVTVYGDRVFTGVIQDFTANGGSVYDLTHPPHNTEVFVGGSVSPKGGGVFELVNFPPSGVQYLVSFNDQQVIFTSGTDAGFNIPISGTDAIKIAYDRSTPIIKLARNTPSQVSYGLKQKIIVDKTIQDPNQAANFAKTFIQDNKDPKIQGDGRLNQIINLTAGHTVVVDYPYQNINDVVYQLLEVKYKLVPGVNFEESNISVKFNRKKPDMIDTIKDLILRQRAGESADVEDSDVFSRLEFSTGNTGQRVKSWIVKTASIGSDWYLGSPAVENGFIGSPGSYFIGSHSVNFVVQQSGGEL